LFERDLEKCNFKSIEKGAESKNRGKQKLGFLTFCIGPELTHVSDRGSHATLDLAGKGAKRGQKGQKGGFIMRSRGIEPRRTRSGIRSMASGAICSVLYRYWLQTHSGVTQS
jgi:hypothetical protein